MSRFVRRAAQRLLCVAGFGSATMFADVGAQTVAARQYDKPLWTSAEGFTYPTSLRELKDGRVIVTEFNDVELWLLSNTGKRIRQIGRRGGGPQEFETPLRLIALPGDSTLLVDRDQRRFLLIDPDGKPVGTVAPPKEVSAGVELARDVDQRGRVYFSMRAHDENPSVPLKPSVPLLRWDRATNRVDTAATITVQLPEKPRVLKSNNESTLLVSYYSPFPSEDGWVAMLDGTMFVVRSPDYHVDVIPPAGPARKTAPIPYTRVAVTAAERKKYEPRTLPEFKPAFSASDLLSSPDGEVWVNHYRPDGGKVRHYDVLNAQGARIATVEVPAAKLLLAVTRTKVYFSRTDADGLQWIEAYAR